MCIECQIYCIDKGETKYEIVHQSKIWFECVIKRQIYYVNKCGTEYEIESQTWYNAQSLAKCVIESQIESHIPKVKVKVFLTFMQHNFPTASQSWNSGGTGLSSSQKQFGFAKKIYSLEISKKLNSKIVI